MVSRTSVFVLLLLAGLPAIAQTDQDAVAGKRLREPWTTSRIFGTPQPPPPYRVERAFEHLEFDKPVVLTNAPDSDRLYVAQQAGRILSFVDQPQCRKAELVVDLKDWYSDLTAIYGLTFHPNFAENRLVFVCYVRGKDDPQGTVVSRFKMSSTDPPTLDLQSERAIIRWRSGGHNGGCLKFGPDGFLYISTGDAGPASPPDPLRAGQDVGNLLSSILRLDVDLLAEEPYAIPPDNPFVDVDGARPEIWAYGFRNPWKISFDRQTGDLWVGDVGWELWEMIYRVQRGGNYGWSITEGRQSVLPEQDPGPTPILPPTIDHPHSEAGSITGGFVYRGQRLADLFGTYIYGDYQSGIVWGVRMEDEQVVAQEELAATPLRLVGFGESNAGELYLLDYQGEIFRLIANDQPTHSRDFPTRLSETGLFASVVDQRPATGVVEYSINATQWADHLKSRRWLAVPGQDQITIDEKNIWQFPDGSVIAKSIGIDVPADDEANFRRLETQILHRENGSWRPYTYAWNTEQTDALLVDADGFTRVLEVSDVEATGGKREYPHRFSGRRECSLCHNPWVEARTTVFGVQSASPLAISSAQLDRLHQDSDGSASQLLKLRQLGLLGKAATSMAADALRFADPYDETADLDRRARSWLHVNCSHCHQFNAGGAATIRLGHDTPLDEMKAVDVRPTQGVFGIGEARIIAPGNPYGSVLFYRIAKIGAGRMPRLGSHEVDQRGVQLIRDWIQQLSDAKSVEASGSGQHDPATVAAIAVVRREASPQAVDQAIDTLASTTRGALQLMNLMLDGDLSTATHDRIVARTKEHTATEVRDLFERFVPASQRVKRLGDVVDQAQLLSLEADANRGQKLFFSESSAACRNCHLISGIGQALGPDLTKIGSKYRRPELLRHILQPSLTIDPKYVPYLLETTSGKVLSGLLVARTDTEVVLRDAANQQHQIDQNDIERLVRQQKSLMPELLLRDMTPQQVADLLAYLSSLK